MLNRIYPRIRVIYKVSVDKILAILGGIIALILSIYGACAIDFRITTWRIFSLLPYICSYNKRMMLLNKLEKLDEDVTSTMENLNGIRHRRSIVTQKDMGFKELIKLDFVRDRLEDIPDQIIYEASEQTVGIDHLNFPPEKIIITALKARIGNDAVTIYSHNPHDPMKIIRDLKDAVRLQLRGEVATITVIGSFLLVVILIVLTLMR